MADLITKRYLPKGIDKAPETVVEALTAARTLLAEENRWRTSEWFKNEHPDLDPDDPFCNSWAVCAEGAVALVVVGAFNGKQLWEEYEVTTDAGEWDFGTDGYPTEVYKPEPWCVNTDLIHGYAQEIERQLYDDTVEALRREAGRLAYVASYTHDYDEDLDGDDGSAWFDDAWTYNDNHCNTAQDVLDWFDSTIKAQEDNNNA